MNGAGGSNAQPTGVPGAMSNQPPTPATAPINGASQPLQGTQANGAGGAGGSSRRDAVTNYEVDKTVRVTRNASGTVKRLNAAVVINHITKTDAKGKTTTTPLSQEELDKLTALVKEGIGFNEQRGDSVKLITAPFQQVKEETTDTPFWKDPSTQEWMRSLLVPAAMTLLALIVVFGAIRPAINAAKPPKDESKSRLNAVVDDEQQLPGLETASEVLPALESPGGPDRRLEAARQLAKDNPVAMAGIVRAWVNKE